MQVVKSLGAVVALGVLVAACGGGAPTQGPGATQPGGGGGGATAQPGATNDTGPGPTGDGGNGGTIGFEYGKVTFTVTGPIETSGELGFIPMGSMFGGDQGTILNFGQSDTTGTDGSMVSVVIGADESVVVSYLGTAGQMPGATCTTSDWNIGANTASGKFDCTATITITASGATVAGGNIKGEFTAHT